MRSEYLNHMICYIYAGRKNNNNNNKCIGGAAGQGKKQHLRYSIRRTLTDDNKCCHGGCLRTFSTDHHFCFSFVPFSLAFRLHVLQSWEVSSSCLWVTQSRAKRGPLLCAIFFPYCVSVLLVLLMRALALIVCLNYLSVVLAAPRWQSYNYTHSAQCDKSTW